MARAFVDTNVAVYAVDRRDARKQAIAQRLLRDLLNRGDVVISSQVLAEFAHTALRKLAMAPEIVQQQMRMLASGEVVLPTADLLCSAVDIQTRYSISFWDACIVQAAVVSGCDVLYSEDLNPGQWYDRVQVVNPFAE